MPLGGCFSFAVRDVVEISNASISAKEPSFKRLRSMVSTSFGDSSLPDRPKRIQSVARVPNLMATMIKSTTKAVEDMTKVKMLDVCLIGLVLEWMFWRLVADMQNSDSLSENERYDDANVVDHGVMDVS